MLSNFLIFLLLFLVSCKSSQSINQSELLMTISFFGLLILVFLVSTFVARWRINRIKNIYFNTKNQLHFWDKLDRIKLEDMLQKGKLPSSWLIKLNNDKTKIEDIYFYDGKSAGRIAQDKEKLFTALRNRIKKS